MTRPRSVHTKKHLFAACLSAASSLLASCSSDSPAAQERAGAAAPATAGTSADDTAPDETTPKETPDETTPAKLDAATVKPASVAKADAASLSAHTSGDAGAKPMASGTPADAGEIGARDAARAAATEAAGCLDGITDYENPGPFKFATKSAGAVKLWVPTVPAGCKVPVIHLANGTTANCGNYQQALERMATHGFLTTCYEDPNTGAGTYGIKAFETALSMYPDLADKKLGSTGHSQGGQAALITLQLAEAKWGDEMIYTGLAMEPASGFGTQPMGGSWQSYYGKVKSPVFMFSGDSATGYANSSLLGMSTGDGLVAITWVQEGFDALSKSIEAYHWTSTGATHIPTPEGAEQQISIPWFRWKLLGDSKACEFFKKMADGTKWKSQKQQNATSCQ